MKFKLFTLTVLLSAGVFMTSCQKSASVCCSDGTYTICEDSVDAATFSAAQADCNADPACSCD